LLDLLFDTINLLRDYVWGGIAVVVAIILILTSLGFLAKTIHSSRTSDLTRDELRLLKAFNEQAKENRSRDLSVEFAAYKAEVDNYEVRLQRLKALGYLQDSNIKGGYLGHRPVRITAKGVQRAEKRR
jgi:hypothetical protein